MMINKNTYVWNANSNANPKLTISELLTSVDTMHVNKRRAVTVADTSWLSK